jgi:hypothetical protein
MGTLVVLMTPFYLLGEKLIHHPMNENSLSTGDRVGPVSARTPGKCIEDLSERPRVFLLALYIRNGIWC